MKDTDALHTQKIFTHIYRSFTKNVVFLPMIHEEGEEVQLATWRCSAGNVHP
jgi:hypothetical protein